MPQPPPKPWKRAVFTVIAQMEHVLRGGNPPNQSDLQQIRNFLVLQYESPLGSIVHATPFFEALKRAMPDAHVTVAASSMAASVLDHNPYIDRCVVTPDPFKSFRSARGAVRELFQSMPPGPCCIVTMIGNRRPKIALLSLFAGSALRIGHTAAPQLYTIPLTFVPGHGQIEGNLDILRALGHPVLFLEPQLFFTQNDAEDAARWFETDTKQLRIAFVIQNSGGQLNGWPHDRFREVIARLTSKFQAMAIFPGTAADVPTIDALRQSLLKPGISIAGKTTVPQLAAVLAQCDLAISLDTGAFHVARAVGLPAVVIAPAWQDPHEWLPLHNPRYRIVRGEAIAAPPPGYCMEEINAEQVVDAAIELLELFPASVEARQTRLHRGLADLHQR